MVFIKEQIYRTGCIIQNYIHGHLVYDCSEKVVVSINSARILRCLQGKKPMWDKTWSLPDTICKNQFKINHRPNVKKKKTGIEENMKSISMTAE